MKKIAIFALTRGYPSISHYQALILRNIEIVKNLRSESMIHIDMLLFHEGNISYSQQLEIQRLSNTTIKFISLADYYLSWNNTNPYKDYIGLKDNFLVKATSRDIDTGIPWSTGYRNMCYFYALLSIEILGDLGYSHALRIDEDCIAQSSINEFFDGINDHSNALIGTPAMFEESHKLTNQVLPNLLQLTGIDYNHSWLKSYETSSPMVYSNVNLYFIDNILNNKKCLKFLKIIRESAVIHRCRLGDAPLLFWLSQVEPNGLHIFKNFRYQHLSHRMDVADGKVIR